MPRTEPAQSQVDFLRLAAIAGSSAVILGAFGAHGLRSKLASLPDGGLSKLRSWETAGSFTAPN